MNTETKKFLVYLSDESSIISLKIFVVYTRRNWKIPNRHKNIHVSVIYVQTRNPVWTWIYLPHNSNGFFSRSPAQTRAKYSTICYSSPLFKYFVSLYRVFDSGMRAKPSCIQPDAIFFFDRFTRRSSRLISDDDIV